MSNLYNRYLSTCKTCQFAIVTQGYETAWTECHRHAPVITANIDIRGWPSVQSTDTCGEYAERKE